MENTSDEIEALKAIYCLPGEFEMDEEGEVSSAERQITINLKCENCSHHVICLKVFLGGSYPFMSPEISLSSCSISGTFVRQLCKEVQEILSENIGFHVLLDITSYIRDKLNSLTHDSDTGGSNDGKTTIPDSGQFVILLHLDHMRAQTQYIRIIKKWTSELSLTGRLIFFKKLIFVLLSGCSNNLKKYVTLNRTRNVDIDSKGHSCKERMLSVLCEHKIIGTSTRFTDFQVVNCETEEEVKKIFCGEQLRNIFHEKMMLGSGTTAPKLDRKSLPKESNLDVKTSVVPRKISQTQNFNLSTTRPRAGTWGKRERSTSMSSRDRHHSDQDKNSSSSMVDQRYVHLENTYQLEPDAKFQVKKVEEIIASILQRELQDEKYDPVTSARSCILLSDTIKEKVKALNMRRYRIICCVIITEKAQQSMAIASRFCWDKENDNFACVQYNQPMLHAVGMVFGVYLD